MIDNTHSEWEKWHSLGKCTKPFNWHIVSASNMTVTLNKQEKVKILFKFQSFREPV